MVGTPREIDGVSVVVRGHFNPAIFSPAWLLGQELVGPSEYKQASVDIVSRDLASFSMDWLTCQVTPEAMQVATTVPEEFERTRDVAAGVLRALSHTPIAAIGLNREVHSIVRSADAWHRIGDRLAPKELWDDVLTLPGMRSLLIESARSDEFAGRVYVKVEPSMRMPQAVYISHNDHYVLARVDSQPTSREQPWEVDTETSLEPSAKKLDLALEVLAGTRWSDSMSRADRIFASVMGLAA